MSDNTIQLKGEFLNKERAAGGAISPGHLVELDSSDEYIVHAGAGEPHGSCFAVEDSLQGLTVTDAYAAADRVQVNYQTRGNEVMALLEPDLGGTAIAIGDFLESAGDGTLRLLAGTDRQAVGVALEAIDLTASGDVAVFIKIEVA